MLMKHSFSYEAWGLLSCHMHFLDSRRIKRNDRRNLANVETCSERAQSRNGFSN
jgi:hypothetical protein